MKIITTLYEILPHRRKKIRETLYFYRSDVARWMRDLNDGEFVLVEVSEHFYREKFFTIKDKEITYAKEE